MATQMIEQALAQAYEVTRATCPEDRALRAVALAAWRYSQGNLDRDSLAYYRSTAHRAALAAMRRGDDLAATAAALAEIACAVAEEPGDDLLAALTWYAAEVRRLTQREAPVE